MCEIINKATLILEENGFIEFDTASFVKNIDEENKIKITFADGYMRIFSGKEMTHNPAFDFRARIHEAMDLLYYLYEIIHMNKFLIKENIWISKAYPSYPIRENSVLCRNRIKFTSLNNKRSEVADVVFYEEEGGKRCFIEEETYDFKHLVLLAF